MVATEPFYPFKFINTDKMNSYKIKMYSSNENSLALETNRFQSFEITPSEEIFVTFQSMCLTENIIKMEL